MGGESVGLEGGAGDFCVSSVRSAAIGLAASLVVAQAAAAAESIIRDTEIEADIRTMVTPIWKAAGLEPSALHVYLVEDKQINSFVAGGQNEFINTGLIMRSETPNQLIGVLAHETGHIAGGHLTRFQEAARNASIEGIIAMVLGAAAAVAGRGSGGGAALLGAEGVARARLHAIFDNAGSLRRSRGHDISRPQAANRRAGSFSSSRSCRARSCLPGSARIPICAPIR